MNTQPAAVDALFHVDTALAKRQSRKVGDLRILLEMTQKQITEITQRLADFGDPARNGADWAIPAQDQFDRLLASVAACQLAATEARELGHLRRHVVPSAIDELKAEREKRLIVVRAANSALKASTRFVRINRNGKPVFEFDPSKATVFETSERAWDFIRETLEDAHPETRFWPGSPEVCYANYAQTHAVEEAAR